MSIVFENNNYNEILSSLKKNKNVNKDNICAICRESLILDTIDLHCKHRYHTECLMNSFLKYESKKCPLCSASFIIDSYKTKCNKEMKNDKICSKICYNNESLCSIHLKSYFKEIEKKNNSTKKKEIDKIKRTMKNRQNKLQKLLDQVKDVNTELDELSIHLSQIL